ncbi:hypothetical protein [Flavobacterium sandaracinum]|nr:hypothetical protein [Flavobacterium sandaracinum]
MRLTKSAIRIMLWTAVLISALVVTILIDDLLSVELSQSKISIVL